MMKRLLLGIFSLGAVLTANAQDSCANAIEITNEDPISVPTISGDYVSYCWGGDETQQDPNDGGTTTLMANWYSYTPSEDGLLTITSVLDSNPVESTDTRVSVFTGDCENLECYNVADDVDLQNADYRATLTIPVEVGVTYYIAWDNNWSDGGFNFSASLEQRNCLSPNDFGVGEFYDFTLTSASLSWNNAINNPANYDVEVGIPGFTPGMGEGTSFFTSTNSVDLTGLSTTDNEVLYVYLRANCDTDTYGDWKGPFLLYLPAVVPYENGFEFGLEGFDINSDWFWTSNEEQGVDISHEGEGFVYTNTSTTDASDGWIFSRGIYLEAGQEVTIAFYTRLFSSNNAVTASLDLTVGNSLTVEAQNTVLETITTGVEGNYTERMVNYTPTETGTYHFGFHNTSAATASPASLIMETLSVMETPASADSFAASQLSVFPNPANNIVNITNKNNTLINTVEVIDLNGRTVKLVKFDGVSEAQINISELSKGVYLMNIATDNGSVTKKIVKN